VPQKKRMGRPPTGGRDAMTALRLPPKLRVAIDNWAAQQPDKPSRSEAMRRLIEQALSQQPRTKR
jgi:hypothetical protein